MDALISQINCGSWIILIYESNLDGLKWIEYIDKGDTKRKIERKVGETERGRKRGGRRERDVRLSIASLYSFTFL